MSAKDLLQSDDTCALALYHAFQRVFRSNVDTWEPESIRLEAMERKLDIPEENYDAYHAFRALRMHPAVFWDGNVFENTVMALNGYPVDPASVQTANPGQIAWAVEQIRMFEDDDYEFDYEPVAYTAVSCKFYGLVYAPDCLSFARERLEEITPEHAELREDVKKRWAEIEDPTEYPYDESQEGVQLALLASIYEYLRDRRECLKDQLASL